MLLKKRDQVEANTYEKIVKDIREVLKTLIHSCKICRIKGKLTLLHMGQRRLG